MARPGSRGGKRGRPKKSESEKLGPTPELLKKKRFLVGESGDLTLAESPIGVMFARGILSDGHHQAARIYEQLYCFRNGKVHPGSTYASLINLGIRHGAGWDWDEEDPEARSERLSKAWRLAIRCLLKADEGRGQVKSEVENVVVFRSMPTWLIADIFGQPLVINEHQQKANIIQGLEVLRVHWRLGWKKIS